MDKILVSLGGIGLVGFIWWFFFGKRDESVPSEAQKGNIEVIVEGGYKPSVIKLKKGVETTLVITRKDPNTCLEEIVLPDFKIKKYLPLNEKIEIKITPAKSGEFPFHCGMNMFHGKLVVD